MRDLRNRADEINNEFAQSLYDQFKKERYGIGCRSDIDLEGTQHRKALLEWQSSVHREIFDRLYQGQNPCHDRLKTAVAFFGWLSDPSSLTTAEAILAASEGNAFFPSGGPVSCDYTVNDLPRFLWMAELATEPVKTRYRVREGMEGGIGDPDNDLFGLPVIVGIYRLYVTVYPTQQTENAIEFKVY